MDNNLSFIGLMRRAGAVAVGTEAAYDAARAGKARAIVLASDASKNTVGGTKNILGDNEKIKIITLPYTKQQLGEILGRKECAIMAICDKGFANSLAKKLETPATSKKNEVDNI